MGSELVVASSHDNDGHGAGSGLVASPIQGELEEEYKGHLETLQAYRGILAEPLTSNDELQVAAQIINDIRDRKRKVEAIMRTVTEPLNTALRQVRAWFAPTLAEAEAARALADQRIIDYGRAEEAARKAGRAALTTAIKAGNKAAASVAIEQIQPQAKAEGVSTYKAWDFEELNHDIVPTQFTMLDTAEVRKEMNAQVKSGANPPAISGIRFFQVDRVRGTG